MLRDRKKNYGGQKEQKCSLLKLLKFRLVRKQNKFWRKSSENGKNASNRKLEVIFWRTKTTTISNVFYLNSPDRVRGNAFTLLTSLNAAIGPITSLIVFISSSDIFEVDFSTPSLVIYKHKGICPFVTSETPKTAASAISGSKKIFVNIYLAILIYRTCFTMQNCIL